MHNTWARSGNRHTFQRLPQDYILLRLLRLYIIIQFHLLYNWMMSRTNHDVNIVQSVVP